MGREYERLFGALPKNSAPSYLCERVFGAIHRERVRILRRRLVFSSCTGLLSLLGVTFAVNALAEALQTSGFTDYASLIVSDHDAVFASANVFLYTLLESLPGPETVTVLALLAILIQSVRVMVASYLDATAPRPALA
jgi:hypothetical protein